MEEDRDMSGPTARLLSLLSLLQTPRTWAGGELAERLEVTPRTVRRDVERLRELGYPVEADLGAHGGYRLVAGAAMPPLLLEDDEAVAVALGLRTIAMQGLPGLEDAGVRALAKLGRSLPARLRYRVRALGSSALMWRPSGGAAVDPELLATLAGAIENRERVRMRYERRDGEEAPRHVEPVRLVSAARRWYLVAFDLERDDWRTFRVDRIRDARGTRAPSRHDEPDAAVLGRLRDAELALASVHRAEITLQLPPAVVAERLRDHLGDGELTPDGEGTRWRTAEDTVEWLAMRLLGLDCPFVVHGPPELQARLDGIHERTRR
jgi:predicted DNA-binding transcriptional regulator YafY